jgi:transcriptional regulator with XRE-family HTH domain
MSGVTPEEWRVRVGAHVEARRGRPSIRQTAERAGISEGLWRQIESGRRPLRRGEVETVNPKPDTRARVCRALNWTPDSIDRLLAGLEPIAVSRQSDDAENGEFRQQAMEQLAGLSQDAFQQRSDHETLQDAVVDLRRRLDVLERQFEALRRRRDLS